jgi:hypothetical protein
MDHVCVLPHFAVSMTISIPRRTSETTSRAGLRADEKGARSTDEPAALWQTEGPGG